MSIELADLEFAPTSTIWSRFPSRLVRRCASPLCSRPILWKALYFLLRASRLPLACLIDSEYPLLFQFSLHSCRIALTPVS
eukprot:09430_4